MPLRSRLADAARGLEGWLEAPSAKATSAPYPVLDLMEPAPVAHLLPRAQVRQICNKGILIDFEPCG